MSNLDPSPAETLCGGQVAVGSSVAEPVADLLDGHDVALGRYTTVRRLLPHRERRMVGAWCFADHFDDDVAGRPGMRVPPHPHIGLQTVTWLVAGEVRHTDGLGSDQVIVPGQLNLMTSGRGIAHAEQSPPGHSPVLHGLQLWVALPGTDRGVGPHFAHHADLPVVRDGAAAAAPTVTVVIGELAGVRSPARVHTPLLGAEVVLPPGSRLRLPVDPVFEHAAVTMAGEPTVAGSPLATGGILYLGTGRSELTLAGPGRLFLLGGEPFEEELVMWWNFVGRTHEEIVEAREDWAAGGRFAPVGGYDGDPLPAPPMPTTRLKPRGRTGRPRPDTSAG